MSPLAFAFSLFRSATEDVAVDFGRNENLDVLRMLEFDEGVLDNFESEVLALTFLTSFHDLILSRAAKPFSRCCCNTDVGRATRGASLKQS